MPSAPTLESSSLFFSVLLEAAFAAASVAIAALDILTGVFNGVDPHSGACPFDSIQASKNVL